MLHGLYYNSYHDTSIKINAKHLWRFLYSSASLFVYLRSSLANTRTYAHIHTYAYAHLVDFAYQRFVCSRNVTQPETRSFELGFSQLYIRHTVSRCPPSLLVSVSRLISFILTLLCSSYVQIRTIEPASRRRLQIERITHALAVVTQFIKL